MARAGPPRREDDPDTISMTMLESGHYYQVCITPQPQCQWNLEAVDSMLQAQAALPGGPSPLPHNQPQDSLTADVSWEARQLAPGACPLLPLAAGSAPLAAHQGLVGNVEVPPGWLTANGGHFCNFFGIFLEFVSEFYCFFEFLELLLEFFLDFC